MDTLRQDSFRFGRRRKEVILNTYRMEPKITPRQIYPTVYKKLRKIVSSLAKACHQSFSLSTSNLTNLEIFGLYRVNTRRTLPETPGPGQVC